MSTDRDFVDFIQSQSGLGAALSYRRMFGEYALYLHGKVVALACDNQLYLKPTAAARGLLGQVPERPPYPGARPHLHLDEQIEDRELLREVFEATARALPMPRPRPKPGPR